MTDTPRREPSPPPEGAPTTAPGVFAARLTPARPDLAARYLEGRVEADRFASGTEHQVTASVLPLRREPRDDAMQETQSLFGEVFTVYDEKDGWAWGQAAYDGYVGYVAAEGLSLPVDVPTHRVRALRSYRLPEPDLKAAPLGLLTMSAKLKITETSEDGKWRRESRGGWVFGDHLIALRDRLADPVAVMEAFLGAPYFWGGRESLGLDCSGLIQNGYEAAGLPVPRDADMQEVYLSAPGRGEAIWTRDAEDDADGQTDESWRDVPLRRGDLVYWRGHTGVMVDEDVLLHANATHMAVTRDPLTEMVAHLNRKKDNPVTRIVRPRPVAEMRTDRSWT